MTDTELDERIRNELRAAASLVVAGDRVDRLVEERLRLGGPDAGRSRRPVGLVAAAAVVIVALSVVTALVAVDRSRVSTDRAGSPAPSPFQSSIARATGARLFVAADDGYLDVDVDARVARRMEVPGIPDGWVVLARVVQSGDRIVVVAGPPGSAPGGDPGTAFAVSLRGERTVVLGDAVGAVAGATPGRVWLRTYDDGGEHVAEVGVDGVVVTPRFPLPASRSLVAVAGGTLVLERSGGGSVPGVELWSRPSTAVTALGGPSRLVASHGSLVAWVDLDTGVLNVNDVKTGRQQVVPVPPGRHGFVAGGAFSPDGRRLAAFALVTVSDPSADLVLVDPGSGSASIVPGTDFPMGESLSYAAWDPSGRWVFFSQMGARIVAAAVDGSTVGDLRLPVACFCFERYVAVAR